MSDISHAFAAAVKAARKRKGLTQLRLAENVGASLDAISALEREVNVPSIETAARLIRELDIDPNEVFGPETNQDNISPEREAIEAKLLKLLAGMDDNGAALLVQLAEAVAATHPSTNV